MCLIKHPLVFLGILTHVAVSTLHLQIPVIDIISIVWNFFPAFYYKKYTALLK